MNRSVLYYLMLFMVTLSGMIISKLTDNNIGLYSNTFLSILAFILTLANFGEK